MKRTISMLLALSLALTLLCACGAAMPDPPNTNLGMLVITPEEFRAQYNQALAKQKDAQPLGEYQTEDTPMPKLTTHTFAPCAQVKIQLAGRQGSQYPSAVSISLSSAEDESACKAFQGYCAALLQWFMDEKQVGNLLQTVKECAPATDEASATGGDGTFLAVFSSESGSASLMLQAAR